MPEVPPPDDHTPAKHRDSTESSTPFRRFFCQIVGPILPTSGRRSHSSAPHPPEPIPKWSSRKRYGHPIASSARERFDRAMQIGEKTGPCEAIRIGEGDLHFHDHVRLAKNSLPLRNLRTRSNNPHRIPDPDPLLCTSTVVTAASVVRRERHRLSDSPVA